LLPAQTPDPERSFADVFAAVLTGENPDGGVWGDPGRYLEAAAGREPQSKEEIQRALSGRIDRYRVLIVPGFMSACAAAPAFEQTRIHLKAAHGVDAELLQVPDDSCENNGLLIARFLRSHAAGRKFLVLGHSKGAVDLQLALQDPAAAAAVAGFISLAGAVGGSPLADIAEGRNLVGSIQTSFGCAGKIGPALQSLRTDVRRSFLANHPDAPVPSWSLVAASELSSTSKILLPTWGLLGAGFRGKEDGMLLAADGVLPGATFLGTLLADHVAVAHDFGPTKLSALYDKSHFPRTALLEAVLRFVTASEDRRATRSAR
jgi:hypothetical protein